MASIQLLLSVLLTSCSTLNLFNGNLLIKLNYVRFTMTYRGLVVLGVSLKKVVSASRLTFSFKNRELRNLWWENVDS